MAKKTTPKKRESKKWHAVPLKSSFMIFAILGFLITAYLQPINFNFSVAFMVIFIAMFIASLVSMSKVPIESK